MLARAFRLIRQHPTVAIGGLIVLILVLLAVFAPWLGTRDPTALSPIHRTRNPGAQF
jgi:peptide/nickel transport system permease protein